MFEFAHPWLWLLLPLPILALLLPRANARTSALKVPFFNHVQSLHLPQSQGANSAHVFQKLIALIVWALVVCAAAKPEWVGEEVYLPTTGRDLLIAVDISGSMDTPDMVVQDQQLPRIAVVKHIVGDFIERRVGDRLGLVLFGSSAYLQSPLTFDRATVKQLLVESSIGLAGPNTAIGDALGLAIKRLRDRPAENRVVILLTDGQNTAGEVAPRQAADLAKQSGVKVYTIGVGANEMIVQDRFFGLSQRKVNPSKDLDEDTLIYMAETTGGQYFRAHSPQELNRIYKVLDDLEPVEQDEQTLKPITSLYMWPLGIAFALTLLMSTIALWPTLLSSATRSPNHTTEVKQ